MICDKCHKNESTVHYQQVINGQASEIHLCEECASEKGMLPLPFENPLSFGNMLTGLLDEEEQGLEIREPKKKVKCKCGWTDVDLKKTGYLGCPLCYKTFNKSLVPLFRRIHGSNKHVGKMPAKIPIKERLVEKEIIEKDMEKIKSLREELQGCINEEKYEQAAKIRDEIKKIEKEFGEK
ncbi:MAG: UvrB/UvrC motif-containing protein [Candidatus Firestonebacteria bacterium]